MDEPHPPLEGIDRREFLNRTWKVLGTVLVVEAAWTSYDLLTPRSAGGFGGVVEAGRVAEFPEGTVRYLQSGKFYVTSVDREVHALFQKCPHLGCRVPFCSTSQRFECPCHGSKFNLVGEYIEGPTPRGLDRFPVAIEDEKVLVDTGELLEGPARGIRTVPSEAAGPSCLGEPAAPQAEEEEVP